MIAEVKKLAVDTEAAIKAHLVQVQRAREVDEASVSIPKVHEFSPAFLCGSYEASYPFIFGGLFYSHLCLVFA